MPNKRFETDGQNRCALFPAAQARRWAPSGAMRAYAAEIELGRSEGRCGDSRGARRASIFE